MCFQMNAALGGSPIRRSIEHIDQCSQIYSAGHVDQLTDNRWWNYRHGRSCLVDRTSLIRFGVLHLRARWRFHTANSIHTFAPPVLEATPRIERDANRSLCVGSRYHQHWLRSLSRAGYRIDHDVPDSDDHGRRPSIRQRWQAYLALTWLHGRHRERVEKALLCQEYAHQVGTFVLPRVSCNRSLIGAVIKNPLNVVVCVNEHTSCCH